MLRAREAYARIRAQAAPFYGLAAAIAMGVPLLAGALTGHAAQGSMIALGAYLVVLRAPEGPYGARARNLASAILVVALGATIGGVLSDHPWGAVVVVPLVVALGTAVPWIGATAGLAVLLTAIRPVTGDATYGGFLELLGGLLAAALLLAPWPARRLRPLRTTLAEAAGAVAEALDAVAEDIGGADDTDALHALDTLEHADPHLVPAARKPDWDAASLAASRALTAARATSGFYRSGRDRREPTRPERLIDALSRILQETIALRSLIEAVRRNPPEREWEMEARVAVAALAARVRLLAGAIESGGEAPFGTTESAAIRRLGRQSEVLRRAGLAGDEDLVAVALVVQIRRSAERIAGGVDAARRIVAGGIRIGFGPPRLPPDAAGPVTAWERLGRAVRTRSPTFREVGRVGLVALLAMALATALKLPHGHWLTITAMVSLRGSYGQTIEQLVQRVIGTAVGSVIAAVLLTLAPGQVSVAIIVAVLSLIAFALRTVNFTYWMVFLTPLAMMLLDFSVPSDWTTAGERIVLTLAGAALAFAGVRLLWPSGHAESLRPRLDRMLSLHADLTRSAAAVVEGRVERLSHEEILAAEEAAEKVSEVRERLAHERLADDERIARLDAAVAAAHRIRDHLIAIGRMSREQEVDAGPLPEILDRLGDRLEEAADALEEPASRTGATGAPSPSERLDEEFSDLDTHLSALARRRREEIEKGVHIEEFTPLRHALLQVSGTRFAVRSLRGDTETLIENSQESLSP
ncbi:FUSC family protein [Actinomadura viridis]|uniref:FUSC family protein n=1 Tax=Actinomadura viridis TaxID=58110 RepID=UPI00368FCC25